MVDDAQVGADLIDLADGITEIGIDSDVDEHRIVTITDPDTVAALVNDLATAPVDLSPRPESERDGPRYLIELIRADTTTTTRAYFIDTGELSPGIDLPDSWRTAVQDALTNSDADTTPTPSATENIDTAPAPAPVDGPVIRRMVPDTGVIDELMALLQGRLEMTDGCLYLVVDAAGRRYPIVWPTRSSWDPVDESSVLPPSTRVHVGDDITAGGGFLQLSEIESITEPEAGRAAAACLDNTTGEIAAINTDDGAIQVQPP